MSQRCCSPDEALNAFDSDHVGPTASAFVLDHLHEDMRNGLNGTLYTANHNESIPFSKADHPYDCPAARRTRPQSHQHRTSGCSGGSDMRGGTQSIRTNCTWCLKRLRIVSLTFISHIAMGNLTEKEIPRTRKRLRTMYSDSHTKDGILTLCTEIPTQKTALSHHVQKFPHKRLHSHTMCNNSHTEDCIRTPGKRIPTHKEAFSRHVVS